MVILGMVYGIVSTHIGESIEAGHLAQGVTAVAFSRCQMTRGLQPLEVIEVIETQRHLGISSG